MAEGEGFEPPVPFRVQRFSRPPVSTTHATLRASGINSLAVLRFQFAPGCGDFLWGHPRTDGFTNTFLVSLRAPTARRRRLNFSGAPAVRITRPSARR